MSFAVILPAAGRSSRFGSREKKQFAALDGRAVWLRSAELFVNRDEVKQCLILIAPDDVGMFKQRYAANLAFLNIQVIEGGKERFESVANALAKVQEGVEFVAIHDAVRPCTTPEQIDAVFAKARQTGAAILGVPASDTLKQVDGQRQVKATLSRQGVWLAQTPQVFRREWLVGAYAGRVKMAGEITDDAQLVEATGHEVHVVEGSPSNIKITTGGDVALAKAILDSRPRPKASGPIHPFAEDEMWR